MREKINVLFGSYEALPFLKTGGLGDVAGTLPKYINNTKIEVRVILPKVNQIPQKYVKKMEFLCSFEVPLGWRKVYCGLFKMKLYGVTYYFLDNEYYFHRNKVYGEFDDGERMAFFSKAIVESILHMDDFEPDILHCNDWHCALSGVFLREQYKEVEKCRKIKTIFTIHNLKFQGKYDKFVLGDILGLTNTPAEGQLMDGDAVNFLKGACSYADRITTVSPTYAEEICLKYYGEGLDYIFRDRKNILSGILNGINYKEFDPLKDKNVDTKYSYEYVEDKADNKLILQEELGLEENKDKCMIAMIGRLTEQKGIDLLVRILEDLMNREIQLVILGTGDYLYEEELKKCAAAHSDKMRALITFDNDLAHRIYAGADIMLIPSRFEPCGLTQMMAMRYGTIPIVRETGGLKDTVIPYNEFTGDGTGFGFANFNAHELLDAIDKSLGLYYDNKKAWLEMMRTGMQKDFSWKSSAKKYRKLYEELI